MKILYLHGWKSTPGSVKPSYLSYHGHEVFNPILPDDDFDAAVRIAQAQYNQSTPNIVVGSSRGGAVAMNIDSGDTPLVLLCPAWKKWGTATTVKSNTVILHSVEDDVVPYADSAVLVRSSGLSMNALQPLGWDHHLADDCSLRILLQKCEAWDARYHAIHESSHALVGFRSGLSVKRLSIGEDSLRYSGHCEFCSHAALLDNAARYLLVTVAGKIGTQVLGYRNRLVSENHVDLDEGEEPCWSSDEMRVWERDYSPTEIQAAEARARSILEKDRLLLIALAQALEHERELGSEEIERLLLPIAKSVE